ncbi:aminotransferase class I/II-fold pyridoxal phosphate-dependent enzyme [Paenibacillus melissococcoides]|uniref:Aminotransferase class I/II-fold pyridoxal phosphate-dependent enzyme n=1 Tax=Paenibacillus melissococcoides TaxID=2912268 RepID=A0ABM9G3A3_9BACL|nr:MULTISPECIES: aminotransferase class V-fold PLP-dependent enzyme [Paenibacillus]MEB9895079.1 aminotransferase class I/II-fold pyridoxal phosphate-dependent enzyme [Bacillus cereus]CAH8246169.1 aminotransferase class I/II-fold pyridoxal phosphate-dependent enzyme [Paenibacillus melissococcoides]CAH8713168.1 aminotransferase class I/II-fold pyridoxal phosphate-dependent enzyme [Paenibacillus melissococcoides]CAH8713903.1 aminotransferase class I/II-fold pyridoxal phosphate-dependent enzyme [Pa
MVQRNEADYRMESRLAQIGSVHDPATGAVNYPIYQATAYRHPRLGQSTGFDYIRTKNPTRAVLEEAAAALEHGDAGFACSSGMAAIQTVFAKFGQGDHLIVSLDLYGGTYRLLERIWSRCGVTATYVDTNDLDALESSRTPETKAVFIETPTNPLMMITDIERVAAWAKKHGLLTIVDNTLLTPFFQRPLELGADIVVHSATKYLGGHNDVLAGLIVTKGRELSEEMAFLHNSIGAVLSPSDSYQLMRGMKTLALRMERHEYNATRIAEWLLEHPAVEAVYYPGLADHPGCEIQRRQSSGNSGIFSFRLKDARYVDPILRHLKLIAFAESLGGVESLMTYPAVQTHADIPAEIRDRIGVDDRLLRFSVGIEHVDDLTADLAQALEAARLEVEQG